MKDYRQILLMRTDLKMPKGKLVAQGAHASMKAYLDFQDHPNMQVWLDGAFTKVAVKVDSEEQLMEAVMLANLMDLPNSTIIDAGRTIFDGVPTLTCGCVGPASPEQLSKITGHLKLL